MRIADRNSLSISTALRPLMIAFAVLVCCNACGQILTYTNNTAGVLSSVATNVTATPLSMVNGTAAPGAPCSAGYSAIAFSNGSVYNPLLPAIEVTAVPDNGFTLNVSGFSCDMRRSASGPANIRYAYSTDGGTTWVDQGTDQLPNNGSCGITATGSWTTSLSVSAPAVLKFRLYGYNATSGSGSLQLLNLIINGNVITSPGCPATSGLNASLITPSSATLGWTAIGGATAYNIRYRPSGSATWINTISATPWLNVSGLSNGTIYEYQVQTVCGAGTGAYTSLATFTTTASTASASSGKISIYFNTPVDNTLATAVNAVYLHNAMADTLIAYLNRARYTVDIAQYDYNQSTGYANIASAVNDCYARGVRVRWIYDGAESNTGLALLNPAINTLGSPTTSAYGIMHHKFVIIDANSPDANDAIVSTGSEDWGITQFNYANNNILFIQDSALAHAYLAQFNMMWGDTGVAPNVATSKFGPFKTDLGAHIFTIGGKTVELYFSPSDHTDSHIQSSINSANTDLYFGVFTFTQAADANAIVAKHNAGVYTPGIVDNNSTLAGSAYGILSTGLGSLLKTYVGGSIIYHNKMLIVDPSNTCSDPLVLTGSHNWSAAADTKNDENTLIIHNDTIANIYYQSFAANYAALAGTLDPIAPCAPTSCGTPAGLNASSVGTTTVLLGWGALSSAISYTIQYRETSSSTWNTTTSATNTATLSGLTPSAAYEFQVQATCTSGTGSFSSSATFTTLALPCSVPTALTTTGINTSSATISWLAVSGAAGYILQYRVAGTTTWTADTTATNTATIAGLAGGTSYEYKVQVICSAGTGLFSPVATFVTTSVSSTCGTPTGLYAASTTGTTAILSWTNVSGSLSYNIRYRVQGTIAWMNRTAATNTIVLTGMTPGANYECEVQALCGATQTSSYSSTTLFHMPLATGVESVNSQNIHNIAVYPNPAQNEVTISYALSQQDAVSIELYNIVGQKMSTISTNEIQAAGNHTLKTIIPAPGIYWIKIAAGSYIVTQKIVRL